MLGVSKRLAGTLHRNFTDFRRKNGKKRIDNETKPAIIKLC